MTGGGWSDSADADQTPLPEAAYQEAAGYMRRKGLGHLQPTRIIGVEGGHVVYLYYVVDSGLLELEVSQSEVDDAHWRSRVSAWRPGRGKSE